MRLESRYTSSTEYFPIPIPDDAPRYQRKEDPDKTREVEKEKEDDSGKDE